MIKKLLFVTILLPAFFLKGFSQVESSCDVPWGLQHYYKRDVVYVAFKRLYELKSPDTCKIEIPQIHQDSIWKGLAAIYNVTSIPQRDSVFDIYCIHNILEYSTPLFASIVVKLDTSYNWTNNWLRGEINTGYSELDSFLTKYDFFIREVNPYGYNTVNLHTYQLINPNPIIDSLIKFDGIDESSPDVVTFLDNANKIEYSVSENSQFFKFTLSWGDCWSGCAYKYKWCFKVNYNTCHVEYLGIETNNNEDLPSPTNCNITSFDHTDFLNNKSVIVYPNPTSDILNISGENINYIELWNNNGLFKQVTCNKENLIRIEIAGLESGLYFIKIITDKQSITKKLIIK